MATDIDLIGQIIDLKVERAVAVLMGEMKKLADAHNKLANEVVPPLVADLNKRKKAEEKSKDEQIAALQKTLADMQGAAPPAGGIVIPPADEDQG